jgi:hypothetical protein
LGENVTRNKLLLDLLVVSLLDILAAALAGAAPVVKMTVGHKCGAGVFDRESDRTSDSVVFNIK